MRNAQSDFILDLVQSATKVEAEIETHAEEVALGLAERFVPLLGDDEEGPETPDFQGILLVLKAGLSDSREKLSLAEESNIGLIRQAIELRNARQELTDGLYEDLSSMRRTVEELYRGKGKGNPNAFIVAGIQGPTLQRPASLLRQVDLAVAHLSQPGLQFPVSRFNANPLVPQELTNALKPRAERLHQVQAALRRLGSELNASRKKKNRVLKTHESHLLWVSRSAEALFQLAGEPELAVRIRPTSRRAPRRDTPPEGDSAPAEKPEGEGAQGGDSPQGSGEAGDGEDGSGNSSPDEPQSTEPTTAPADQRTPLPAISSDT